MENMRGDRRLYVSTYLAIGVGMALAMVFQGNTPWVLPMTILGGFGLMTAVRIHEQVHSRVA